MNTINLADIYRILHPMAEYTLFSSAHETLSIWSKIDHMLSHKTSLNMFKRIEIIHIMFSDLSDFSRVKLGMNSRKKSGELTNTWKLNSTLINSQWVEEITREIIL